MEGFLFESISHVFYKFKVNKKDKEKQLQTSQDREIALRVTRANTYQQ